ncbi:uncharacterized protein JCM10292_002405 [Rhodotorula paludigena]|uniref:uncharacterized protein n=1 Tax=Rhodotorula paludigena TaxID=86838 RepID=UPI0031745E47
MPHPPAPRQPQPSRMPRRVSQAGNVSTGWPSRSPGARVLVVWRLWSDEVEATVEQIADAASRARQHAALVLTAGGYPLAASELEALLDVALAVGTETKPLHVWQSALSATPAYSVESAIEGLQERTYQSLVLYRPSMPHLPSLAWAAKQLINDGRVLLIRAEEPDSTAHTLTGAPAIVVAAKQLCLRVEQELGADAAAASAAPLLAIARLALLAHNVNSAVEASANAVMSVAAGALSAYVHRRILQASSGWVNGDENVSRFFVGSVPGAPATTRKELGKHPLVDERLDALNAAADNLLPYSTASSRKLRHNASLGILSFTASNFWDTAVGGPCMICEKTSSRRWVIKNKVVRCLRCNSVYKRNGFEWTSALDYCYHCFCKVETQADQSRMRFTRSYEMHHEPDTDAEEQARCICARCQGHLEAKGVLPPPELTFECKIEDCFKSGFSYADSRLRCAVHLQYYDDHGTDERPDLPPCPTPGCPQHLTHASATVRKGCTRILAQGGKLGDSPDCTFCSRAYNSVGDGNRQSLERFGGLGACLPCYQRLEQKAGGMRIPDGNIEAARKHCKKLAGLIEKRAAEKPAPKISQAQRKREAKRVVVNAFGQGTPVELACDFLQSRNMLDCRLVTGPTVQKHMRKLGYLTESVLEWQLCGMPEHYKSPVGGILHHDPYLHAHLLVFACNQSAPVLSSNIIGPSSVYNTALHHATTPAPLLAAPYAWCDSSVEPKDPKVPDPGFGKFELGCRGFVAYSSLPRAANG